MTEVSLMLWNNYWCKCKWEILILQTTDDIYLFIYRDIIKHLTHWNTLPNSISHSQIRCKYK